VTTPRDYENIAALCRSKLDLSTPGAGYEWYLSLPLCIIDTAFSIGARYTSTRNTPARRGSSRRVEPVETTPPRICPRVSDGGPLLFAKAWSGGVFA